MGEDVLARVQNLSLYFLQVVQGGHCRAQWPGGGNIMEEVRFHSACESIQRPPQNLPLLTLTICLGVKVKMMAGVVPTWKLFFEFIILTV